MNPIAPELLPQLVPVVDEGWDEPIDRVANAQISPDGNIIALAYSGNLPLAVKIDGESIEVKPVGETETEEPPSPAKFAAPADTDPIASYLDRLSSEQPFTPWLDQIQSALTDSDSLQDYENKLEGMFSELPSSEFRQLMSEAIGAANLLGYFEASQQEESEFAKKIPEGTIKRRDGKYYVLTNSRWHLQQSAREIGTAKIAHHLQLLEDLKSIPSREQAITTADRLLDKAAETDDPQLYKRFVDAATEVVSQQKADEAKALAVMGNLRTTLLETGLSRDRAKALAEKIDTKGISNAERIRDDATEFLQMTNGVGTSELSAFKKTGDRAYASALGGYINIGSGTTTTIWHEMGHFAEDETGYKANRDWILSKATGNAKPLSELTGNSSYGDNEIAFPGKFVHPYVGKWYPGGGTEVFSVGIEHFTSPESMLKLWQADSGHFELVVDHLKEWRNVSSKN